MLGIAVTFIPSHCVSRVPRECRDPSRLACVHRGPVFRDPPTHTLGLGTGLGTANKFHFIPNNIGCSQGEAYAATMAFVGLYTNISSGSPRVVASGLTLLLLLFILSHTSHLVKHTCAVSYRRAA